MSKPVARPISELDKMLGPKVVKSAKAQAKKLLREMKLAELRHAAHRTQKDVAKSMRVSQAAVSAMEKRSDFHISTLTKYVKSLGGELHLFAEFPNGRQVELSSFTRL